MTDPAPIRTLTLIVCGAGPAPHADTMITLARTSGWSVQVIATAAALPMIDPPTLEAASGSPVRTNYESSKPTGKRTSAADALIIAPATYNTINKLALGINDTYPLNVAAEAIGRGTPTAILPFVNTALAARQPFLNAINTLRGEGVSVLYGPGQWLPHPPGAGSLHLDTFPWHKPLQAIDANIDDIATT
jgi:phosphopantothenoylcysteine synthetase/decarboxylase